MATHEQFQQAVDAWERLDAFCVEAESKPGFKDIEVSTFQQMSLAFKGVLDKLEPDFWKLDPENLTSLTESMTTLGDSVLRLFQLVEKRGQ